MARHAIRKVISGKGSQKEPKARRSIRKTDVGTILLHWTLVALLTVATATGLRIALTSPDDMTWLHAFDAFLPQSIVWTAHIPVGTTLSALAISYTIYLMKSGLFRRVRPDLSRMKGLAGRAAARYSAINIVLYWVLFTALLIQLVTGTMLYIGYGGWAAELHRLATWVIIAYAPCHIAVHYAIDGKYQLLRVFNPGKLSPPAPAFDPFELIAAGAEKPDHRAAPAPRPQPLRHPGGGGQHSQQPPQRPLQQQPHPPQQPGSPRPVGEQFRRGEVLRAHPLITAIAGGFGFLLFLLTLDTSTRETLTIDPIPAADKPVIDGDVSEPVWRHARPVTVPTQQGANLAGTGQSWVEIRAVHDDANVYFSFVWEDPTRSMKHLPLVKMGDGWHVLQEGFDKGDATAYFEDKFAVLLIDKYVLIPGDRTFHAGRQPLADKPATLSGRGMHYTNGGYACMWQWHASTGGMLGYIDDAHFGPPAEPTEAQKHGKSAYKGGFAHDAGAALTQLNFEERGPGGYNTPVTPKRLPRDIRKAVQATRDMDIHPDHSDSESSAWWLTEEETVAYSREHDARIPVGTVIPGVLITGSFGGDRAHIRGMAKWASGRWSLEIVRRMDTGSRHDMTIATGLYMRVAVFDHTQSRHTRFIRPIRLEVNRCEKAAECKSTTKALQLSGAKSF